MRRTIRPILALLFLSSTLTFACGGAVEDSGPGAESASPARDGGACSLVASGLRLVPSASNGPACGEAVACDVSTGHGAYWTRCAAGVGTKNPVSTDECDKSTCRCTNGAGFVIDFATSTAYGANDARTCTYSVERTP